MRSRCFLPLLTPQETSMSNPKLLTQRNYLRNRIKALADDAGSEDIKKKLQKLSDRALKMDEKGTSDYSEFLDVIYDNQDRLDTLESDLSSLRRDYEKLLEENSQLKADANRAKNAALRRQVAINVEYELKLNYLQICPINETQDFVYASGPRRGEYDSRAVTHLQLYRAKKLAKRHAAEADYERVRENWFGTADPSLRERLFASAMLALKDEFTDEAHPTAHNGKEVDVEMARQLVLTMPLRQSEDPDLRNVAGDYVDKLGSIRQATGETNFLFR